LLQRKPSPNLEVYAENVFIMCDVIVVVKYNTSSAIYLQWDYQHTTLKEAS
jgi:hypothetical protein